jgi:hypothetical protein
MFLLQSASLKTTGTFVAILADSTHRKGLVFVFHKRVWKRVKGGGERERKRERRDYVK